MTFPHSGCDEHAHSAQAVVSGRWGVQIGTVGVGKPGVGFIGTGIIGVPAIGGIVGITCGGAVPGLVGIDPREGGCPPLAPAAHRVPPHVDGGIDGARDPLAPRKSDPWGCGSSGVEEQPSNTAAQSAARHRDDLSIATMDTRMRTVSRSQAR